MSLREHILGGYYNIYKEKDTKTNVQVIYGALEPKMFCGNVKGIIAKDKCITVKIRVLRQMLS